MEATFLAQSGSLTALPPAAPGRKARRNCPCGLPLHYGTLARHRNAVQRVRTEGWWQKVTTPAGSWWAPRHFLWLHPSVMQNPSVLPEVARRLRWPEAK